MSSRTGRLIIVDDNDMNRDMLARRLQRLGYEVSLADSARELHQRMQDEHIDLVVLDVEMPEISGLDALKTRRENYSTIELPIMMVTARMRRVASVTGLSWG